MPVGQLDVAHVTLRAAHGRAPLIYDLSFSLAPGTALGVIGRSGAGKTTLARVLLGLIEPTVGEVRLGGALITQYAPEDLGRAIGYLPQDPSLLPGSISENIARMALEPDSAQVIRAAQKAGVHDLILSLPEGYDTVIGPDRPTLSGGERQRIALARAFYGDPVVLVLDEPNSALDQDGSAAMNAAVAAAKSDGTAVIIMTHRPMAIAACDRLMVLENGRISALGPRDEVLKSFMKNADGIQRVIGGTR